MKVKLFISHALDDVETEINHWLASALIRVHHVTQSQSEKGGKFVFIISVFYQPNE